jgi:hypothetical protein
MKALKINNINLVITNVCEWSKNLCTANKHLVPVIITHEEDCGKNTGRNISIELLENETINVIYRGTNESLFEGKVKDFFPEWTYSELLILTQAFLAGEKHEYNRLSSRLRDDSQPSWGGGG